MSGLPEGWEADYDGRRWFYKYKPTGHVQYHFPKEGDEFPDFIDSFSPAPDLAPEERLESQHQVRRQGSTVTKPVKKDNGGMYGMSATARPVSMTWDGTFEEDNTVFQPENFMYLGPGTYTDVSPLAEEEDEAAKRIVAGSIEGRVDKSPSKGVSPLNSAKTTPSQSTTHAGPIAGEPVLVPPTVVEEVHEMPSHEPPPAPDPVGIIAEMPTYDTAQAQIETHPPPIEMGDNTVLAPIETAVPLMAELPERTSPTKKKKDEPQLAPGSLRNYSIPMRPLKIDDKPVVEAPPEVQSYKPGEIRMAIPPNPPPLRRSTFQPGGSMVGASPVRPPDRGHAGTPNVLSPPQVPPKMPLDEPAQPQIPPKHAFNQPSQTNTPPGVASNAPRMPGPEPDLSHMPSVLKPARGKGPQPAPGTTRAPQSHGYVPPTQGKHPPSMTPAPVVQQQRPEEPRMSVQRVNTVPESLPSQRPQSMIQNGHQGLPASTANSPHMPKRPVSVMPDMMGTQTQAQFRSPVESVPPKGLPRSATAGPGIPFPPYPVDNPPYPDDRPAFRREDPPYPEEPFVQKPLPPNQGHINPSPPLQTNRRHSSYSSAMVSPDSRHGSMSFPVQTPSPMEHSRRASTSSSSVPNYVPSPVSQNSQGFSPTPPSAPGNQYQQGSYFNIPDVDNQGHNTAARDVLRRQSLSRGVDPRRNSVGADPVGAQRGSPLPQQTGQGYNGTPQGVPHSQSLPQVTQINTGTQNQRPVGPSPSPPGQQSLGRIEEYEEAPGGTISRSSTASVTSEMRKGSVASSAQPSPMGSRRASWQAESPRNISPGQFQGPQGQISQNYMGQPMPQGQVPQGAPMPPQNPKQLQRKPSQMNAPQLQSQQMPVHDTRMSQGMPQHQDLIPQGQSMQGQMLPTQARGNAPHPGQINTQGQNTSQGPAPSVLPPKPVPTRLQKRSSYGPPSPAGQTAPPNHLQGPLPPSLKSQNQVPQQGPVPGHMPPLGQPNVLQKAPPGRVQPQVQIPRDQGGWQPNPHPVMPPNQRPVSMQPQTTQSAGAKEGKEGKKWLKWLKGGSKSVSHSPTTPVISSPISPVVVRPGWGGGEYSQQAVWQPGQPVSAGPQLGPQGNMPPPQSMQTQVPPQPMQMTPQQVQMHAQASQRLNQTIQAAHESNRMAAQSGQPSGVPLQPGQALPQAGQLPPQRKYSPPQQAQMPIRQGQAPPIQGQMPPPQPGHLSFQKRLSLQQMQIPAHPDGVAPMANQAPSPGSAPIHRQPEPQTHPTGATSVKGLPVEKPADLPSKSPEPVLKAPPMAAPNNVSQRATPPRQPSPAEIRPLEQLPKPQLQPSEPPPPPLTSTSHNLQPDPTASQSLAPHVPAVSPGLSEAATSSLSRMSSQRSCLSDAGSITTIEMAQAQPQHVLKPSIVQVKRRSTDMWRQSQEFQGRNSSQSSSDVTPRLSAEITRIGTEPVLPPSNLQRQQAVAPEPTPQIDVPQYNNDVKPLFSNSDSSKVAQPDIRNQVENKELPSKGPSAPLKSEEPSPIYTNDDIPNQQNKHVQVKRDEPQLEPVKPAPVVEDKWAKKPVVDYSGGDWGDDDDWDY